MKTMTLHEARRRRVLAYNAMWEAHTERGHDPVALADYEAAREINETIARERGSRDLFGDDLVYRLSEDVRR